MTIHSAPPKLTYADLLQLPEDLLRHELIDGEHYMSPAPALKHQYVVLNLARILSTYLREHRLGRVMIAPVDVVFSEHDVVEPDLLYVSNENADRLTERYVAGAPDLAVEVLSPSSRGIDRIKKRRLYETRGVPEYWIVDPLLETLEVYRTAPDGSLAHQTTLAAGDTLATPLLIGLEISLREVFE